MVSARGDDEGKGKCLLGWIFECVRQRLGLFFSAVWVLVVVTVGILGCYV